MGTQQNGSNRAQVNYRHNAQLQSNGGNYNQGVPGMPMASVSRFANVHPVGGQPMAVASTQLSQQSTASYNHVTYGPSTPMGQLSGRAGGPPSGTPNGLMTNGHINRQFNCETIGRASGQIDVQDHGQVNSRVNGQTSGSNYRHHPYHSNRGQGPY